MLSYDIRHLEHLEPFLAFVEALTKPEALQGTIDNLRSENAKYQELLGAFKTKQLVENEAHRILDEAETKAKAIREKVAIERMESDERQARLDQKGAELATLQSVLEGTEKTLKKREEEVTSRENLVHEKDIRVQTLNNKLAEWERDLRKQADLLAEKAEKIKALVG